MTTWAAPGEQPAGDPSRVTFDIRPHGDIVRLTVTHENLADEAERDEAAAGKPMSRWRKPASPAPVSTIPTPADDVENLHPWSLYVHGRRSVSESGRPASPPA